MKDVFSLNETRSKIASLYLSAFSPSKIIELITGFSSTIILSFPFINFTEIFKKKEVS